MVDHPRARRIADRVKVIVAQAFEREIKDPRLGFVTITDVRVTGDLQHASIFYTVLGDEADRAGTVAAIQSAQGVVRREVGRGLGLRLTPSLDFIPDGVQENASHIDQLLRQAAQQDADVAAQAAGKTFAGDVDPYRHRELAGDDETSHGNVGPLTSRD
ncbi:MAG: 30S ribosome-binding factor RbfA [Actinomycetota bacterium]